MAGTYVPISGVVGSDGSLLALQGLVSDPDLIVPPGMTGTEFESDAISVGYFSVTAQLLASIGFGSLMVSGESNTVYWVIDVMPTASVASTVPGSPVATWVYGVGVRVAVRGISVTGTAALSLQNLAASATLNGTSTSFEFDGIGIGFGALPLLNGLVDQSLTGFDVRTMQELGNVINDLTAYLADSENASELTPQVIGVIFATGVQVQSAAAAYGWALRGIAKGLSQEQLAAKTPKNLPSGIVIDPDVVASVYADIVGSASAAPNSAQKSLANQLSNSGP